MWRHMMALRNMTRRGYTTIWLHHMRRRMGKLGTLISLMRIWIVWGLGRWSRTLSGWPTRSLRWRRHWTICRWRGCHFVSLCICQQKNHFLSFGLFQYLTLISIPENTFKVFLCTNLINSRYFLPLIIRFFTRNYFFLFTIPTDATNRKKTILD